MKLKFVMIIALVGVVFSSQVEARCMYEGQSYPTGTRVGNLTCQADGRWR
jgi:hypothetical protein